MHPDGMRFSHPRPCGTPSPAGDMRVGAYAMRPFFLSQKMPNVKILATFWSFWGYFYRSVTLCFAMRLMPKC